MKIQNASCQMGGREDTKVIKLLLSAENEWSRSCREINQHPNLPWNFITHGILTPPRFLSFLQTSTVLSVFCNSLCLRSGDQIIIKPAKKKKKKLRIWLRLSCLVCPSDSPCCPKCTSPLPFSYLRMAQEPEAATCVLFLAGV